MLSPEALEAALCPILGVGAEGLSEEELAAAYTELSEALIEAEDEGGPSGVLGRSGGTGRARRAARAVWALVYGARTFRVAQALLRAQAPGTGRFYELGSGWGPFGLAAALAGASPVHLVDVAPEGLEESSALFEALGAGAPSVAVGDARGVVPSGAGGVALPFSLREMVRREADPVRAAVRLLARWVDTLAPGGRVYVVEAGTRRSARFLQEVRDAVAPQAEILAPCTGAARCPLLADPHDWCHFTWSLPLGPTAGRIAERAGRRSREQHFSWLVLGRRGEPREQAPEALRVLEVRPRGRPKLEARLCGPEGLVVVTALQRSKDAHRLLEGLRPGELVGLARDALLEKGDGLRLDRAEHLTRLREL